jgi:hypothetical protein
MRFTQQTGFRRSGPNAICQDHEALLAVREFTFDLQDEDFVRYFEGRTGVAITWSPRCGYAAPFACSDKEWQQVCRDTMQGDETFQRIIRGKLEDAWELWQAELERERDTRKVERTRGVFPARTVKATKAEAEAVALADRMEPTNLVFADFDPDEYIVTASPYAV